MDRTGAVLEDKYEVFRLLGRGGMGSVYEGMHRQIKRKVAIKFLNPLLLDDSKAVERFKREATAAGLISHDNICEVLDFGVDDEAGPFIVMPQLQGEELSEALDRSGPFSFERACDIVTQILSALESAHKAGVIHRDLKPGNIFLTTVGDRHDFVKVLDFGISKWQCYKGGGSTITKSGEVLGTPHTMSPEQARGGRDIDERTDIYSVGVILYEMLTGQRPFGGDSSVEILWKIWNEPLKRPRAHRTDIPTKLENVVLRAMARDRKKRFRDAGAFRAALGKSAGADDKAWTLRTRSNLDAVDRPPGSRRTSPALVVVSIVVLGLAVVGVWQLTTPAGDEGDLVATTTLDPSPTSEVASLADSDPPPEAQRYPGILDASGRLEEAETESVDQAEIELLGLPADSRVAADGQAIEGKSLRLPRSSEPLLIVVEAPGFFRWRKRIIPRESQSVMVRMRPRIIEPRPGTSSQPEAAGDGQNAATTIEGTVSRFGKVP